MIPVFGEEIGILISPELVGTLLQASFYMAQTGHTPRRTEDGIQFFEDETTGKLHIVIPTQHETEGDGNHDIRIPAGHWKYRGATSCHLA